MCRRWLSVFVVHHDGLHAADLEGFLSADRHLSVRKNISLIEGTNIRLVSSQV